jgi:predicted permease
MAALRALAGRCLALFRRRQLDDDLDAEVRTHLELLAEEYQRRGMTSEAARRAARRDFGGVELTKEIYRDRRGLPWLEVLWQDVAYAGRQLRRAPVFAFAAIVTLGLSVGATVTVFSVVDAVLLRPLTYPDADRLVTIYSRLDPFGRIPVSDAQVRAWRPALTSFNGLALLFGYDANASGTGEPERVAAARVTPELFRMLGVQSRLGRLLRDEEDVPGRDQVVVISDQLWRRRFNADPTVIGQTMMLDGVPYEIVGVLPSEFHFPRVSDLYSIPGDFGRPDVWKPFALPENDRFSGLNFAVIGRLRAGVTVRQAQAELDTFQRALLDSSGPSNATIPGEIVPLQAQITRGSRRALEILLASVLAVLLIAAVNVTNLILARSTARRRELAMRASMGASRGRLVRQLFTEGMVLAAAGGVVGTVLAIFGVRLLTRAAPMDIPRLDEVRLDNHSLVFAALISAATALVVGLVPAWRSSRLSPWDLLRAGGYQARAWSGSRRTQSGLVMAQVGITAVCAIVAALLLQSLVRLLSVDTGFESRQIVTATIDLAGPRYGDRRIQLQRELIDRLRRIPGVSSVGIGSQQLLSGVGMNFRVLADGTTVPPLERPLANVRGVNADFFATLGIPIESGQTFSDIDARPIAVISRSTAQQLWPGQNAIGKRLRRGPENARPLEVVGIVGDIRASRLDLPPGLIVYVPFSQLPVSQVALAVRTAVDPASTAAAVRDVIRRLDPDLPIAALGTLENVVAESVAQRRFVTALVLLLAGAALTLAVLGVYGLVAQGVTQRTPEIGVRLALGARRDQVVHAILTDALRLVVPGLIAGVAAALASGTLVGSMLFAIVPHDTATIVACCLTIAGAAALAAYIPARRASRVDPAIALRAD